MIRPWPRYCGAVSAPRPRRRTRAQKRCAASTSATCAICKCWFNLAWIHPLAFERDADLREPARQGPALHRGRQERACSTSIWRSCAQIIPLHRKLAETRPGRADDDAVLSSDPAAAVRQEAGPRGDAGRRSCRATPAAIPRTPPLHVRRAVEQHAKLFGTPPRGMWPAEGSVCQAMIPLLAQHGIRWIATDEEILSHSTQGFVSRDRHGPRPQSRAICIGPTRSAKATPSSASSSAITP